jgi:hypothetical protein
VRPRVSESLNLHGYLPIKADYGISVGAIIRHSRDLGVISDVRYRSLNIQLSSSGWKYDEPVEVADEKPLLLGQAMSRAFGPQAVARASHVVGVATDWILRWTNATEPTDDTSGPAVADFAAARQLRLAADEGRPLP